MINYRLIFTSVFLLTSILLIILCILIWRTSILFSDISTLFSKNESTSELSIKNKRHEQTTIVYGSLNDTDKNSTLFETIDETIARIKRDVIVTGTVTGTAGAESALFKIEGMPDRPFQINKQLMDGFIIIDITDKHVVLKNQVGHEKIYLYVQSGEEYIPDSGHNNGLIRTIADPTDYNQQ